MKQSILLFLSLFAEFLPILSADEPSVPAIREVVGTFKDKALKPYRKKIPQQAEGYYLKITPAETIVAGRDEAGLFYGLQALREIRSGVLRHCRNEFKEVLPIKGEKESSGQSVGTASSFEGVTDFPLLMENGGVEIRDWPSIPLRGVIEGFYGNPWSHEDRMRQFEFYGRHRLNTYIYGPKDDPYHRARWRDSYPEAEAERLKELVGAAHRNRVRFVWAIHPGGDIRWNLQDSMAVARKLDAMYDLGIRAFAVFFDDIGGEGAKAGKQAGLMNYLTDTFVRKHGDVEPLIICPTQYNKAWSNGDYLSVLGREMYPQVRIMWTGNSVVDMIDRDDLEWINARIGRKAFIWLNYPVNDYCQSRLLMGKTYGNGLDIGDLVSGFCSNPMEYAEASKLSLCSIADYCWNMPAYDASVSWEKAIDELMPTSREAFHFFCENNVDLGKTGHGLRREGESPTFGKIPPETYFTRLVTEADALLVDSISQPEMLREITPWVETMRLLGQRGLQVLSMQKALGASDTIGFVGHYLALRKLEEKQRGIVSRNFEGSIVRAKPVVSGSVVTPWVDDEAQRLIKNYKKRFSYGRDLLPQQVIEDGAYYMMYDGKYLTDVDASPEKEGDFPVFVAEADTVNPQRQLWNIELVPATGRYKVTNVQDGRYINELGAFWADRHTKPYNAEWNTYIIVKTDGGYTIQCAGRAGSGYWRAENGRITNSGAEHGSTFQITTIPPSN